MGRVFQQQRAAKILNKAVALLLISGLSALGVSTGSIATGAEVHQATRSFVISSLEISHLVPGALPELPWPKVGQGAVAVRGVGLIGSSPNERPRPIASLTKIMTAVVILEDHPLALGQPGPTFTINASEVDDYKADVADGDSTLRVAVGEKLTQYQLLEGLLIPSGDNIADLLAIWDAGSVHAFVAKMNAMVQTLGLGGTHYGDASGLSTSSVSTAADQAKVAATLMGSAVVREIVRRSHVTLPVAGKISNYNPALGVDGIIGIKSGWTPEAQSCLVTAAFRRIHGRGVLVISVTLGQPGGLIAPAHVDEALLTAADHALFAYKIIDSGLSLTLPGRESELTRLEPASPSIAIVWHGLRLSERVVRHIGSIPTGATTSTGDSLIGGLEVSVPWGVIETVPLGLQSAPPTTTTTTSTTSTTTTSTIASGH